MFNAQKARLAAPGPRGSHPVLVDKSSGDCNLSDVTTDKPHMQNMATPKDKNPLKTPTSLTTVPAAVDSTLLQIGQISGGPVGESPTRATPLPGPHKPQAPGDSQHTVSDQPERSATCSDTAHPSVSGKLSLSSKEKIRPENQPNGSKGSSYIYCMGCVSLRNVQNILHSEIQERFSRCAFQSVSRHLECLSSTDNLL